MFINIVFDFWICANILLRISIILNRGQQSQYSLRDFSYYRKPNHTSLYAINYTLFLHFYKQRQAEIGKKIKQMLSNTQRLNFCYLKIIQIYHPRYHPKIIGHILKNKQKNKCVSIHEVLWLIIMKMKMKMKNRPHRYYINRPRSRHGHKHKKYKKSLTIMMLTRK